ncbi:MAG: carbohydrate ABC transporter permease [Bacilli bacterium]
MRWIRWPMLWTYAILIIVPVLVVIDSSFKSLGELFQNPLLPPQTFTTANYATLATQVPLGLYFLNSTVVTASSILMVIVFGSMIAYAVLRLPRKWSYALYGAFTLGMMVPSQANLISVYVELSDLHLVDTLYGLILVETAFLLPVAVFIMGGFMRGLTPEIMEAAKVDGANEWQMYYRIAVPLTTPAIASTAIFGGVIVWNDLLFPLLLLKTNTNFTLPLALLSFSGQYQTNYPVIFAGVLLASIPIVILYLALQKYFIAGMTAGAVKG